MKKIAILQSNYIPWKGYFDIINSVDEFILLDDVQYTKNDWRNRNRIIAASGPAWLTIPVHQKSLMQRINETEVVDGHWVDVHLKSLQAAYAHTSYFRKYFGNLSEIYERCRAEVLLNRINRLFLDAVVQLLGIKTILTNSTDYPLSNGRNLNKEPRTNRLINLILAAGGRYYLSGPAAKDYIEASQFQEAGIELAYMDYRGYPPYPQQFGCPFEHGVSVLDLLFNEGPRAPYYIWGWRG